MLQWLYTYVSSICSKCFIIRRMLQVFLSRCCKSRSGCCIYKHVASVFFKWFEVFHTFVASVSSGCLQWFLSVFRCFCKCFRCMFQMFHLSSLHVATVAFGCFKSRSGDAHGMRMESDWQRWRRPRWRKDVQERHEPAARALACKPDALGCSLAN
jgi:hypothetical protein